MEAKRNIGLIIDINRWRRGNYLTSGGVFVGGVEKGDVLYRVDPYSRGEFEFVGLRGDYLGDSKGS